MNKYLTLFLAVLCAGFASCTKKSSSSNAQNYSVNGISDISIANYASAPTAMGLTLNYISGTQEPVTISISGLPANVKDSISTLSGTPSFSSIVFFSANGANPGTYSIKITTAGASGSKTNTFNLTVTGVVAVGSWKIGSKTYYGTQYHDTAYADGFYEVDLFDASKTNGIAIYMPGTAAAGNYRVADSMSAHDSYVCFLTVIEAHHFYQKSTTDSTYYIAFSASGGGFNVTIPRIPVEGFDDSTYAPVDTTTVSGSFTY